MSTGPTHAISGTAAWGAVVVGFGAYDIGHFSPETVVVGAILASGAALLPDLDHPGSTVSRTFGPISKAASKGINTVSHALYRSTRTKRDSNRDGGHRGLTHTVVFALLAGVLTTAIVSATNKWALPILLFFFCGLAVRGLMHKWNPKQDAWAISGSSALLTILCWAWAQDGPKQAPALGIAVITGCVAHYIGDAITEQGCPMLWPVPIMGKLWFPVAPPKLLRMKTGGKVELSLVLPALTIAAVWLTAAALQRTGAIPWLPWDLVPGGWSSIPPVAAG
ncbi:membrane-bound metal-dependent hydrolase YbcI (DUF457 family) [Crossiella equi]|uniref:Membrane-bound metal-dependent hydrolase YbcI (DUF457 family) n=1 Tax=Crossiella equi TaxID=130796 RepID=A0ABS5ADU5_9PSEU|nr:metal-dependent hydrolase [Crossiella equi]MBP2474757.1 membrane-bound metal-dependent hydrolase YbcI (DUF457 family) [Crossiella equi]